MVCPHCHLPYAVVATDGGYPLACCIQCGHPFTCVPEGRHASLPYDDQPLVVGLDAWLESEADRPTSDDEPPKEAPPF